MRHIENKIMINFVLSEYFKIYYIYNSNKIINKKIIFLLLLLIAQLDL